MGIPKKQIQLIFDPFFTTKPEGSGLGLATCYSIIKRHNGYITVESEEGVGSTFFIYLPASQKQIDSSPVQEQATVHRGKGKILILDDEKAILDTAGEILSYLGYKVDFATEGSEAVALYQKALEETEGYDGVIMDLTIPGGVGGREAIRMLKEIDPEVKAIAASGYSTDPGMADFSKYGFMNFVGKPYRIEELSQVLHDVLHREKKTG